MAAMVRVAPRQWVAVPVTVGTVRATMSIGDTPAQAAFIENVRGHRGRVETYAKLRCPNLRPGRYRVKVHTAERIVETQLQVV